MMSKSKQEGAGSGSVGEHFLMTVFLAAIADRHPPGSPMRATMEAWAKENIPMLLQRANSPGDLVGEFKKSIAELELILSQKEAERAMADKVTGIGASKKAVQKALAAGNIKKALEAKVFFLLRWARYRDLQHSDIGELMELARQSGDQKLLIRLGRALDQKAMEGYKDLKVDKIQIVMTLWWLKGTAGGPGLSRATDEALTDFFTLLLAEDPPTFDIIRKTRQRLGLKKGPKPWFKKVKLLSDGAFELSLE